MVTTLASRRNGRSSTTLRVSGVELSPEKIVELATTSRTLDSISYLDKIEY